MAIWHCAARMDHVVRAFQAKLPHRLRLLPTVMLVNPIRLATTVIVSSAQQV